MAYQLLTLTIKDRLAVVQLSRPEAPCNSAISVRSPHKHIPKKGSCAVQVWSV